MDCWETLGIEPYADKKTIKIAYAKRLKQCRPDDDPEGFQVLHKAYKAALQWVPDEHASQSTPWMTDDGKPTVQVDERDSTDSTNTDTPETEGDRLVEAQHTEQRPVSSSLKWEQEAGHNGGSDPVEVYLKTPNTPQQETDTDQVNPSEEQRLLDEIKQQEAGLSEDWNKLYQRVNALLKSKKRANTVSEWAFLESLPSMQDIEFKRAVSDQLFESIAELNQASLEQKNLYIKRPVINYLNQQFAWDKKWQYHEYHYSRSMLDAVYPYLEEAEKAGTGTGPTREVFYYSRFGAFLIDLIPLLAIFLLLGSLETVLASLGLGSDLLIWWVILYVTVLIPLQESSKHQATIGKRIMGLQVINSRGDRVNFFHAFWRSLVTALCCVMFKATIIINVFLSYSGFGLLQDFISRSFVRKAPNRR